jgi:hypothetical protein
MYDMDSALIERFEAFVRDAIVVRDSEIERCRSELADARAHIATAEAALTNTQAKLITAHEENRSLASQLAMHEQRAAKSVFRGRDNEERMWETLQTILAELLPDAVATDTHAAPHSGDALVEVPLPEWFGRRPLRLLLDWKHYSQASVSEAHISKLARDCVAQSADAGILVYSQMPPAFKGFCDVATMPHKVAEGIRFSFARLFVCQREHLPRAICHSLSRASPSAAGDSPSADPDIIELLALFGAYQSASQDMMDVLHGSFTQSKLEKARSDTSLALKKLKRKLDDGALDAYVPHKARLHDALHRMNVRDILGPKDPKRLQ